MSFTPLTFYLLAISFFYNALISSSQRSFPLADDCRQVPSIENGYPSLLTSQPYFTAWQVNCNPYYRLVGPKLITCTMATGWSRYGKCLRRLECGQVPGIPNGYITYSGPAGSADTEPSRNVKCNRGFTLIGNDTIICDDSGKWSQPGACQPLFNCEFEIEIANGYAQINQWNANTASVTCCGGYQIRGRDIAMCNSATNWQWEWTGSCVATKWLQLHCGPTPVVQNGFVMSTSCSEFGATRNLICNKGYEIHGPDKTTCTPPGFWSAPGLCLPAPTTTVETPLRTASISSSAAISPSTSITTRATVKPTRRRRTTTISSSSTTTTTTTQQTRRTRTRTTDSATVTQGFSRPGGGNLCGQNDEKYESRALVEAARSGDASTFYRELQAGADPNSRDQQDYLTSLILASSNNRTQFMRDLLTCGADVDGKNLAGSTPLMFSSRAGSLEAVEILVKANANPNLRNSYGSNALLFAAQGGFTKIAETLLRYRADASVRDSDGNNALHWAVRGNYTETVQTLLENGAPIDVKNRRGQTALMLASKSGYVLVVKTLLNFGADTNISDSDGNTALTLSQKFARKDVEDLLMSTGRNGTNGAQLRIWRDGK